MKIFDKLFSWYSKKQILLILVAVVFLIIWGVFSKSSNTDVTIDSTTKITNPVVKVTTVGNLGDGDNLSLIGKVRALSEVDITPDRSGRVIKVNTSLGQSVKVGQIIVELENSSERATLLQAEGAYEIAKANSAQSNVGLREAEHDFNDAKQNAVNANQNAYNTTSNVILGTVDLFFANPNSSVPGLKIGGVGNTDWFNQERIAFQTILPKWNASLSETRNLDAELESIQTSRTYTKRVLDIVNTIIPLLNDSRSMGGYSTTEIDSLRQSLTTAQTQITNTLANLDNAYTSLKNSNEKLEKAKISATGESDSVSEAQLKQALGSLRSAQSNYEKTILRSPINGTVNQMDVKVGQFVNASNPIAKIANNTKSEVVVYVNDKEREKMTLGMELTINEKIKGVVAVIAPVIDSITQKTEVRIVTQNDELVIGDTVRVTGELLQNVSDNKKIIVPLTVIKFDGDTAYLFIVEDNTLVRKDVIVGEVRAGSIEVVSGINVETEFVLDARGHSAGDKVDVLKNE